MRKKSKSRKTGGVLNSARLEAGKPLLIAGIRGHFTGTTQGEIGEQWELFAPRIPSIEGRAGDAAYGICFSAFRAKGGFDYLSGIEVSKSAKLPAGLVEIRIPAQKYAVFPHRGHVSGLARTVGAIFEEWLPVSGHAPAHSSPARPLFFGRYRPEFDPATGRGGMEIWLPIK